MPITNKLDEIHSRIYNVKLNVAAELYKLGYITDEEARTLQSERLDAVVIDIDYPKCIQIKFQFEGGLYSYIAVYNKETNEVESVMFKDKPESKDSDYYLLLNKNVPIYNTNVYCSIPTPTPISMNVTYSGYAPTSCSYV